MNYKEMRLHVLQLPDSIYTIMHDSLETYCVLVFFIQTVLCKHSLRKLLLFIPELNDMASRR